jgi:hypothetical protein
MDLSNVFSTHTMRISDEFPAKSGSFSLSYAQINVSYLDLTTLGFYKNCHFNRQFINISREKKSINISIYVETFQFSSTGTCKLLHKSLKSGKL